MVFIIVLTAGLTLAVCASSLLLHRWRLKRGAGLVVLTVLVIIVATLPASRSLRVGLITGGIVGSALGAVGVVPNRDLQGDGPP